MGTTPIGIDGVDLLELEIIYKDRIPPARDDLKTAASHLDVDSGLTFHRIGSIGNYPNGPSSAWREVAQELQSVVGVERDEPRGHPRGHQVLPRRHPAGGQRCQGPAGQGARRDGGPLMSYDDLKAHAVEIKRLAIEKYVQLALKRQRQPRQHR